MATNLERRIETLEARRLTGGPRIAVIHQNKDGTWPDEPNAALVICVRRMGVIELSDSGHGHS